MFNILVMGSKPFPKVQELSYDAVVFANGAMNKDSLSFFSNARKIHLVSDYVFSSGDLPKSALENMKGLEVDSIVIISSLGVDRRLIHAKLSEISYAFSDICIMTRYEFERTYRLYPLRQYYFKLLPLLLSEHDVSDKKEIIKKYLKGVVHLSTGFWCILYSLKEFHSGDIFVSGIEFSSAGYSYTDKKVSRGHFLKDEVALRVLSDDVVNRRRVFFQEPIIKNIQKSYMGF